MKNNRQTPADHSDQSDKIELLASSAVRLHGDTLLDTADNPAEQAVEPLRRVTADEVASLHRRSARNRRASSLRSRTGAIPGRAGGVPEIDPVTGRPDPTKRHHRRGLKIAIIVTLSMIVVIAAAGYAVWNSLMSHVNIIPTELETVPSEYNVPTESLSNPVPVEKGIENILLLGVDARDEDVIQTNSDSMMILTIDTINNKIKLTSLQRDMLVYMPGKTDPYKLNAANSFGGPALAMRVVNDNLRLNISKYVIVNMSGMEAIIDVAGGVRVPVEQDELSYINGEINYQNSIFPNTPKSKLLTKAGEQILNGRQAVAYARIRKLDSDYARMGRQRIVIQALLDQFMSAGLSTKTEMISKGLSYVTTNMSKTELTKVGLTTVPLMNRTIDQLQLPITGYFREFDEYKGTTWVNLCDFNGMIPLLQKFIFGKTYPFDPVKKIPGAPNSGIAIPTTRSTTTKPTTTTTIKPTTTATTETTSTTETQPTTDKTKPTNKETDPTATTTTTTTSGTTSTTTSATTKKDPGPPTATTASSPAAVPPAA